MDTGYLHAVHGIPPNDSIYAGRVVVYVLVVWAMATLDLMFDRTQRDVWRGCGCGNMPNATDPHSRASHVVAWRRHGAAG